MLNSIIENGIGVDNGKFHYQKNCDDKNGISLTLHKVGKIIFNHESYHFQDNFSCFQW